MLMTMIEALNHSLTLELERDKRVVVFGQDIGVNGGVFRVTEHLQEKFGEQRVFDTPLSESAIIGSAVGMSVYGLLPILIPCCSWRISNSTAHSAWRRRKNIIPFLSARQRRCRRERM